jgi:hypothetical protein
MHVLEQVQGSGTTTVEQLHVDGPGVERITARECVHQYIQFRQAPDRDGALGVQRIAYR